MTMLLPLIQAVESTSSREFVELDPYGAGMTLIAMLVVIVVLAFAATIFQYMDNLIRLATDVATKKRKKAVAEAKKATTSGEEAAAIALALHLYISNQHDSESMRLTLNRISRTYSPWSSKIYGVFNSISPAKTQPTKQTP